MLNEFGINNAEIFHNALPAVLYEHAIKFEKGSVITSTGALSASSGEKTGRSPKDKRIVKHPESEKDVNWGDVNIPLTDEAFQENKKIALEYFKKQKQLYVLDVFAGWEKSCQLKVRVICSRPYHALFVSNMFILPTKMELENFGEPDCIIFNAGAQSADDSVFGVTSKASVCLNLEAKEIVILGTEYAGEMKKGIFTIMNYLMPKKNVLSMHCSVNEGAKGDVTVLLGLSGTGKTTLSADPNRKLIGDDEHCWHDDGIFNIEGGCYAKCDHLSAEKEPEIFEAIRFGSLLENVVLDPLTREPDYNDLTITENTRASYKINYIKNAKVPCVTSHASNIIFLTCDAFGVFPPVSLLTSEQALYYFMSGYTAKVSGTEVGIKEPVATFSACFGAPFMVFPPLKYAELLHEKLKKNPKIKTWLVNTGWTGGSYGVGQRISLKHTRSIIDAIHDGSLKDETFKNFDIFNLMIPLKINQVPSEILDPRNCWSNKEQFDISRKKIAQMFIDNFKKIQNNSSISQAGPQV
ncbi:phosphoenolpyruvate carboxykinase (ATP) [Silvanigrella paludirubra]|uniref:Phosphoenolpyruvate carboxykinase (ATP) n=1 Tax=Silvanigrella paludirubra TaxID=2499159 RepID=A0A6N6VRK9_9BACT|nr:phosphoenolpyruvate carboxykinase (ATP) [Silvanigrella paludirubra]KAB8037648.1 phosphoenolpyruvate carboxykinase (ATP) [Silvanigrella paludirubra]